MARQVVAVNKIKDNKIKPSYVSPVPVYLQYLVCASNTWYMIMHGQPSCCSQHIIKQQRKGKLSTPVSSVQLMPGTSMVFAMFKFWFAFEILYSPPIHKKKNSTSKKRVPKSNENVPYLRFFSDWVGLLGLGMEQ